MMTMMMKQLKGHHSLWDWMQLLIVPLALLVVGAWFTYQQNRISIAATEQQRVAAEKAADIKYTNDLKLAKEQQQETILGTYINDISDLMLNKQLGAQGTASTSSINTVARIKTLSALNRLDASRKANILQFLYESKLINKEAPVIDLISANFQGANLVSASLQGANLYLTNFSKAHFFHANLIEANLKNANLSYADLGGAFLARANLSGANLINTNFQDPENSKDQDEDYAVFSPTNLKNANLNSAYLFGNDLHGATLTEADLSQSTIEDVILTDADLSGANFRYAYIIKTDMRGADLTGAKGLEEAEIDTFTIFTPEQVKQFPFLKGKVTVKEKEE